MIFKKLWFSVLLFITATFAFFKTEFWLINQSSDLMVYASFVLMILYAWWATIQIMKIFYKLKDKITEWKKVK